MIEIEVYLELVVSSGCSGAGYYHEDPEKCWSRGSAGELRIVGSDVHS